MSSYITTAKNKATGEIVEVFAHDDYFGRHRYGYEVEGRVLHEAEFNDLYVMQRGNQHTDNSR